GAQLANSNFHLVDPLPSSEILDSPEMENALLMEALKRGAGSLDLLRILKGWRMHRRQRHARTVFGLMNFDAILGGSFAEQADTFLVRRSNEEYDRLLQQEFSSLRVDVQDSFAFEKRKPSAYYRQMRAVFYRAGYSNPCQTIFS